MKIAFDYQGTLDTHAELVVMALDLKDAGWDVIILSAMPVTMQGIREKEIEAANIQLPYKIVYHALEDYHAAAGREKVLYMKEHGISLLVDDNADVIKVVREAGLIVLQI